MNRDEAAKWHGAFVGHMQVPGTLIFFTVYFVFTT